MSLSDNAKSRLIHALADHEAGLEVVEAIETAAEALPEEGSVAADLEAHITDASGAHAATAISNTPSGNLAATTVQAALNELQTDVDGRATTTALTTHTGAASGAHAASAISNTPTGNLASTTVQAALNELQADIDTRAAASVLTALANQSSHVIAAVIVATNVSSTTNFGALAVGDRVIHIAATAGNANFTTVTTAGTLAEAAVVGDLYVVLRART